MPRKPEAGPLRHCSWGLVSDVSGLYGFLSRSSCSASVTVAAIAPATVPGPGRGADSDFGPFHGPRVMVHRCSLGVASPVFLPARPLPPAAPSSRRLRQQNSSAVLARGAGRRGDHAVLGQWAVARRSSASRQCRDARLGAHTIVTSAAVRGGRARDLRCRRCAAAVLVRCKEERTLEMRFAEAPRGIVAGHALPPGLHGLPLSMRGQWRPSETGERQ